MSNLDFDNMSDEDILRIANSKPAQQPPAKEPAQDASKFDNMSDEDILRIANSKPAPAQQKQEPVPYGNWLQNAAGFATGVGEVVPFAQDAAAGIGTGLSYLDEAAGTHLAPSYVPKQGDLSERFAAAKNTQRAAAEQMGRQTPRAQLAGNLVGLAGTVSPVARIAGPIEGAVAARTARLGDIGSAAAGLATSGAGLGAAQGFSEGTSMDERLGGAKTGAVAGSVLGAAIPGAASLLGRTGRGVRDLFRSPEARAEDELRRTIQSDSARNSRTLTPQQIADAEARGQQVYPIDLGGKATGDAARKASNLSEDAASELHTKLGSRYAGQQERYADFLRGPDMVGHDLNAAEYVKQMQDAARSVNKPAYEKAYALGENVWTPQLFRLTNTPSIKAAIPEAVKRMEERAILEGREPIKNPFKKDEAGNYYLPEGFKPSLEFWDGIKRELDDVVESLNRAGQPGRRNEVKEVRKQLLAQLDNAVPEFKTARAGAAKAFGEDDAFSAGMTFMGKKSTMTASEAAEAFKKMLPEEKEYFAKGVMQDVMQRIRSQGESRDIAKLFTSPADREKFQLALGKERADKLEAFSYVEALMTRSWRAVSSNSTTPEQLARAQGAHYVLTGLSRSAAPAYGLLTSGAEGLGWGLAAAAAQSFVGHIASVMGKNQAEALATKLVSGRPEDLEAVIGAIASNPRALDKLRNITRSLSVLGASKAAAPKKISGSVTTMPEERPKRATGGSLGKPDYPAKRLSRMERAAKRAREALAHESTPLMDAPDEQIANALRIAEEK